MLSACPDCKYFHPDLCAVNPIYWQAFSPLVSHLTPENLALVQTQILSCPDWERSDDLEPLTHELTLTRGQWRQLAQAIAEQGLAQALPEALRLEIELEGTGEIVMIAVESSNIEAIGFRAGVCQVDFLSGSRYHYFDVPEWVYQNFLTAPSKGRYLYEVFKVEFNFRYEQVY